MTLYDKIRGFSREFNHVPRFHGNGFTQLYVGDAKRLHVWHPSLSPIRDHNATIHNHRYDVMSHVVHGLLEHTVYSVVPHPDGPMQINIVNTSDPALKAQLTGPTGTGERVVAIPSGKYDMPAGSYYEFRHPDFHTSEASMLTVTVFEQVNDDRSRHPAVLSPWNEPPTHAFDPATAPPVGRLWDAIADACDACSFEIERYTFF